jgi:hypothetical protein
MTEPFVFWGCHEIRESLGIRADTERELAERIRTVPEESIFFHSVRCLTRHQVGPASYPDDFARWTALEAGDPELAERLALFSPFDMAGLDEFREHLAATIEDHLDAFPHMRPAARSPFRFLRGHLAVVRLGLAADDLTTLRAGMTSADDSSIYFHAVESPGRHGRSANDFADWVGTRLGRLDLANRIAAVDPFVAGIGRTRDLIVGLIDETLAGTAS